MKERLWNLTYYLKGGCQNFCTQLHHPPTDMLFWCMAFSASNYNQVLHPFPDSVKESGGRVLVHCQAGISRSATICLAYLIHAHRVRLNEAFEFVKRRRHVISPNLGFMGQLLQFETDVLCPYTVLDSENGATAFQYLCSDNTNLSWTLLCSKETVQGLFILWHGALMMFGLQSVIHIRLYVRFSLNQNNVCLFSLHAEVH